MMDSLKTYFKDIPAFDSTLLVFLLGLVVAILGWTYKKIARQRHAIQESARIVEKNTLPLSELERKLSTEDIDLPELVGRDEELKSVQAHCQSALDQVTKFYVISLWGPQGIGKTHLLYQLGKHINTPLDNWHVRVMRSTFDPMALIQNLPARPCVLLWDDVSLTNDDSAKQIDAMRLAASNSKYPVVIILTTWSEQVGLNRDTTKVDYQKYIAPLAPEFSKTIFEYADQLPTDWQGHPLFLTLLQRSQRKSNHPAIDFKQSGKSLLLKLCQQYAQELCERLTTDHHIDQTTLAAIALCSCSDDVKLHAPLIAHCLAKTADLTSTKASLKKLGLLKNVDGADVLCAIRPDLIGWAFALEVLADVEADSLIRWANLIWQHDFFNTGRFLTYAQTHQQSQHPWIRALQSVDHFEELACLNYAKATVNAISDYGTAQEWDAMEQQLAVISKIAQKFPDHPEIQLAQAKAAVNAINHYGAAQKWEAMEQQLAVIKKIAQKFPDHPEIQFRHAQAAVNAISDYGRAQKWEAMEQQLAVINKIAQKFPDHPEIQLRHAQAAVNTIGGYGRAQKWAAIEPLLNIVEKVVQKFPAHPEIQELYAQISPVIPAIREVIKNLKNTH